MRFKCLIWKNIKKHPYRNIAIIVCFAFVAANILVADYLMTGVSNSLTVGLDRLGADIMVVPENATSNSEAFLLMGQPSTFFLSNSSLDEIAQINGVSLACPQLYIATIANAPCCSEGESVQLIGIDPSLDFTVTPWLESQLGRSLDQDEVIIGGKIESKVGSQVTFYGHTFIVAGQLESTGMGLDRCIFISLNDAYVMAAESGEKAIEKLDIEQGQISTVLVRIDKNIDINVVASNIQTNVNSTHVITSSSLMQGVTSQLSTTTQLLYITTASVAMISLPLIAVISSMASNERRKEVGLLRAMGGSKMFIFKLIFIEAIILAVIGGLVGILISLVGLFSFQNLIVANLQIPFLLPTLSDALMAASLAIALAVTIGSCASLFPAIKSCNLEPYEAIRSGET